MTTTANRLAALSDWIVKHPPNEERDAEAALWGRIAKVGEENGEVIAALIGATGQNPRKGVTHDLGDVRKELLDVAVTALAAVEHLDDNRGTAMAALDDHVAALMTRAGISAVDQGEVERQADAYARTTISPEFADALLWTGQADPIATAVQRVAENMLRRYDLEYDSAHLTWRDFEADARADLEASGLLEGVTGRG